jgi:hypothetical protein
MKLKVTVEVEVSKTMAETMKRNGFVVCPDGTAMQVKIGSAPAIPRRKTKVDFVVLPEEKKEEISV